MYMNVYSGCEDRFCIRPFGGCPNAGQLSIWNALFTNELLHDFLARGGLAWARLRILVYILKQVWLARSLDYVIPDGLMWRMWACDVLTWTWAQRAVNKMSAEPLYRVDFSAKRSFYDTLAQDVSARRYMAENTMTWARDAQSSFQRCC